MALEDVSVRIVYQTCSDQSEAGKLDIKELDFFET